MNIGKVIIVLLATITSIECKSQSLDSLVKMYESTLGYEEIETPIPCDCGNCLVVCVRIDTIRKEPTYHDFVAWLRNEFKVKRLK